MKYKSIKALKVWLLLRLSWKFRPTVQKEAIKRFAQIEADSSWQLLGAYEQADCLATRADLLQQAIEERHHSSLFSEVYETLVEYPEPVVHQPRKSIVPSPFWKFFAYCYVGESAAAERFLLIYKNLSPGLLKTVLKQILRDEAGHVETAAGLAKEFDVPLEEFNREVRRVRRQRLTESWMRSGRRVTGFFAKLWLGFCYVLLAPFCVFAAKKKLTGSITKKKINKIVTIQDP